MTNVKSNMSINFPPYWLIIVWNFSRSNKDRQDREVAHYGTELFCVVNLASERSS
jgi:hypothetical protein